MPGIILYMNTFASPKNPVRLELLLLHSTDEEIEAQWELRLWVTLPEGPGFEPSIEVSRCPIFQLTVRGSSFPKDTLWIGGEVNGNSGSQAPHMALWTSQLAPMLKAVRHWSV